jgi:hypothetical protein
LQNNWDEKITRVLTVGFIVLQTGKTLLVRKSGGRLYRQIQKQQGNDEYVLTEYEECCK